MTPPLRTFRDGVRAGVPFAVVSFVLASSFGVLATDSGFSALQAVVMSAVVFAGSAQFTSLGILAAGGGVGAATSAAALMNSRFVPMGFALGPSLRGSRLRRAVEGQVTVDSSWAMAARGDGTFDRAYLFGHTGLQYVLWVLGTLAGALVGGVDSRALGLDALFPAFFLTLLWPELRSPVRRRVAVAGALVAVALVEVAPPGVPVLAASLVALVALRPGVVR
jgi:4-azaleucine resistance transporter AzlC